MAAKGGRFPVFIIVLVVIFVLPSCVLLGSLVNLKTRNSQAAEENLNPKVLVWCHKTEKTAEVSLEEFVVGVVAAEMPVSFESEALKAQAVAARTFVQKRLPAPWGNGASVHPLGAQICDDFAHCQAYDDIVARQAKWGDNFEVYEKKIEAAIEETKGQVLTYAGELISPSFHSTCGGATEAAGNYWQNDVPALQSVTCLWDNTAPRYLSRVFLSKEDLAAKLGVIIDSLPKLKVDTLSPTGRVMKVSCGDKEWQGSAFRTLLGLNSTAFTWLSTKEGYFFTVQGYGHGVGMCQHGANGMAKAGNDYEKILHHYYTGVEILPIEDTLKPQADNKANINNNNTDKNNINKDNKDNADNTENINKANINTENINKNNADNSDQEN